MRFGRQKYDAAETPSDQFHNSSLDIKRSPVYLEVSVQQPA
jgi:hypothetical protein